MAEEVVHVEEFLTTIYSRFQIDTVERFSEKSWVGGLSETSIGRNAETKQVLKLSTCQSVADH